MRSLAAVSLLVLAGCAFAEPPPPPPQPMTRAEIEEKGIAAAREEANTRGVVKLSADDVIALKKAGASDELLADFLKWERRPVPWNAEIAHERMHDPMRCGESKICSVCGGWVRE